MQSLIVDLHGFIEIEGFTFLFNYVHTKQKLKHTLLKELIKVRVTTMSFNPKLTKPNPDRKKLASKALKSTKPKKTKSSPTQRLDVDEAQDIVITVQYNVYTAGNLMLRYKIAKHKSFGKWLAKTKSQEDVILNLHKKAAAGKLLFEQNIELYLASVAEYLSQHKKENALAKQLAFIIMCRDMEKQKNNRPEIYFALYQQWYRRFFVKNTKKPDQFDDLPRYFENELKRIQSVVVKNESSVVVVVVVKKKQTKTHSTKLIVKKVSEKEQRRKTKTSTQQESDSSDEEITFYGKNNAPHNTISHKLTSAPKTQNIGKAKINNGKTKITSQREKKRRQQRKNLRVGKNDNSNYDNSDLVEFGGNILSGFFKN